ncbi:phosphoribosylaminoimidazole-succinocarboxamide synthase [Gigaspora rosea]|uniref:Phosphoribosylaminoimidazole-succinocarboxamide synthase n=1 Tax=Gigaspora rosea TaxID=44941 RepID=A0A397UY91_9GLOM|nr:phosphoribosylaminoimidazole-succinocarboxamide synthase [Gigaspora rosea]
MALLESVCPDLDLLNRGKVRDLYRIDDETLLFVATDRISAFDVIMKNARKGKILTQISVFWFNLLNDIIPNHLITSDFNKMPASVQKYRDQLENRCLLVKNLKVFPVEAIVRGYITGSAWLEYQKKRSVCDIPLPDGLLECQSFEKPLYTPSTKAEIGSHDENIHPDKVVEMVGGKIANDIAETSVKLYLKASKYAHDKGIIIADTKLEFGADSDGNLFLVDEVLTPDSSRFWISSNYKVGEKQDSFDKQYLRNYLLSIGFDRKTSIQIPENIVQQVLKRYVEIYKLLTGCDPSFI